MSIFDIKYLFALKKERKNVLWWANLGRCRLPLIIAMSLDFLLAPEGGERAGQSIHQCHEIARLALCFRNAS
jgi:hypothetical protein